MDFDEAVHSVGKQYNDVHEGP